MRIKQLVSAVVATSLVSSFAVFAYVPTADLVEDSIKAMGVMVGDENGNMNLYNNVSRAEFSKMMIAASVYQDSVTENSSSSPFSDLKYTHWSAGYVSTAVSAGWITGYLDGTFKPDNTIKLEEAASAVLKMLGYQTSDLSGSFPDAQISKFNALGLNDGVNAVRGETLTRNDCMYIFYNLMGAETKSGAIYGETLGYTVDANGEVDYDSLIQSDIEGPYVLTTNSIGSVVPFTPTKVYINNNEASLSDISSYDVVYYNENASTVWAYSNHVIGTLTEIAPSTVSPTSVVVSGVLYSLGTTTAKNKVSITGDYQVGNQVALLLGMEGNVVDIVDPSVTSGSYYGVVTDVGLNTHSVNASTDVANYTLTLACTDGITRDFAVKKDTYNVGSLLEVNFSSGDTDVSSISKRSISGEVSADGSSFGKYDFASDVNIIDVGENGSYTTIYTSRLAGTSPDVAFYTLNTNGEISDLILDDVTGDMNDYAILTDVRETSNDMSVSGSYSYIMDGKEGVYSTNSSYNGNIDEVPVMFTVDEDGKYDGISELDSTRLSSFNAISAQGEDGTVSISDDVQVYIKTSENYYQTTLSAINTDDYKVYGFYDDSYLVGRGIRIIIAYQ